MKKKFILILSLSICMSFFLVACSSQEINTEDLLFIEEIGYNGYGQVKISINDDYIKPILTETTNKKFSLKKSQLYNKQKDYFNRLSFNLIENENLSNGDTVTIEIIENQDLTKQAKINLNKKEIQYTVSNLQEVEVYDPFANIDLVFLGENEKGGLDLVLKETPPFDIDYWVLDKYGETDYLDKVNDLYNSKRISMLVTYDQQAAGDMGYIIENSQKNFVVEGLIEYQTLDKDFLFNNFSFEFDKAPPNMSVKVKNNLPDDLAGFFDYSVGENENLKIGDTLTVKVEVDQEGLKESGKLFAASFVIQDFVLTKEVTPYYASELGDLATEERLSLNQLADNHIQSIVNSYLEESPLIDSSSEVTLERIYFASPKEGSPEEIDGNYNTLYFLYKATFEGPDTSPYQAYNIIASDNIIITPLRGFIDYDFKWKHQAAFNNETETLARGLKVNNDFYNLTEIGAIDFISEQASGNED